MNFMLFALVFGVAAALPQEYTSEGRSDADFIPILRDDRQSDDTGAYSFDFESANGIVRSESGDLITVGDVQAVGMQGEYSYPMEDGQTFTLKFVANENGYQPESPFLPVAPEFPHPIPQFVLDQIAFAQLEDEEARRQGKERAYE